MFGLGWQELLLIVVLVFLVIFGARRLPEFGRSLGEGIRNLRAALKGEGEKKES